jgi:hypothetical protein
MKKKGVSHYMRETILTTADGQRVQSVGADCRKRHGRGSKPTAVRWFTGSESSRVVPRLQGLLHSNRRSACLLPQGQACDCLCQGLRDHGPYRVGFPGEDSRLMYSLKGGSIPILAPNRVKEEPAIALIARRCETAKPLGMFRSTESEFLLCYDSESKTQDYDLTCQLLASMSTDMVNPTETARSSNGKACLILLPSTLHTFCLSPLHSSRSVISTLRSCFKSTPARTSDALGSEFLVNPCALLTFQWNR